MKTFWCIAGGALLGVALVAGANRVNIGRRILGS